MASDPRIYDLPAPEGIAQTIQRPWNSLRASVVADTLRKEADASIA